MPTCPQKRRRLHPARVESPTIPQSQLPRSGDQGYQWQRRLVVFLPPHLEVDHSHRCLEHHLHRRFRKTQEAVAGARLLPPRQQVWRRPRQGRVAILTAALPPQRRLKSSPRRSSGCGHPIPGYFAVKFIEKNVRPAVRGVEKNARYSVANDRETL